MQNYGHSFDCDNCPVKEDYQRYCSELLSNDPIREADARLHLDNILVFLEMCSIRKAISNELSSFLLDQSHCSDKLYALVD